MRLGSLSSMSSFWRLIREFNPEGIEREATAPFALWVVGEPGAGKRTLVRSLLDGRADSAGYWPFEILDVDPDQGALPIGARPDLVILVQRVDGDLSETSLRATTILGQSHTPTLLVFTHADLVEVGRERRNAAYRAYSFVSHLRTTFLDARAPEAVKTAIVPLLLESLPDFRMALARAIPSARFPVAQQIVAETCKVNAQFALASNLPASLFLIGGIAGNVADLIVLTKNQVMMVFRLAALHGRDISLTVLVAAEIAPVIGGAFAWRTAARMAAGMLPGVFAAAPKMAIAYVGTYVVGQAARFYYAEGSNPSASLVKSFSAEGSRLLSRTLGRQPAPKDQQ